MPYDFRIEEMKLDESGAHWVAVVTNHFTQEQLICFNRWGSWMAYGDNGNAGWMRDLRHDLCFALQQRMKEERHKMDKVRDKLSEMGWA